MNKKAVAILEVMWDWSNLTTSAGYRERAPEYFIISPRNFTGSRLYDWLGPKGKYYDDLLVTNACPELVSSAKGRGKPDAKWLGDNLESLKPFDLLLICGKVAKETYFKTKGVDCRIVCLPHPAWRMWSNQGLAFAKLCIQEGASNIELYSKNGRILARQLP